MKKRSLIVVGMFAAVVSSCAADPAMEQRIVVDLVRPSSDVAAIARHASEVAGVPAHYAASAGGTRHALVLQCGSVDRCGEAIARLRADTDSYRDVDVDQRRRIHSP